MIYTVPFEEQQIRWVKYNANVDADSKYEAFEKVQNIIENGESPTQQADIECNFEKLGDYLDTLKVDISDYSVDDVKEISSNARENWNAGSQEKFYVDEDFTGGVLPNNIVYLQAKDELGLGILVYYHAPFEKKEDAFELLSDVQEQIDSRPLEQQLNLVKRIIDVQLENKDIARMLDGKKSSREVQDNFNNKIVTDSYVVEIYPDEEGRPKIHTGYYQNRQNESDWTGLVFYDNQLMGINTKPYLPNEVADAIEQLGFSVDRESFCNNKTNKILDMQEWQNALNMLQVGAGMRINEVKDIDEQKGVKSIEFVARGLDNVSVVLNTKDSLDNRGNVTVEIQSAKVDLTGLESLDKNSVGFQKIYSKVKYALEYFEVEWKNPFDGLEYDNDNNSTDSDDSSTTQSNTRRNR